jgi:outer membrane protein OmpA-like peptidoglycan-associated protein
MNPFHIVVLFALVLAPAAAMAQVGSEPAGPVLTRTVHDLAFTSHDLVFKVVDVGGGVRDLEVKESETEIRIELAADVLFDFDKADIRPDADKALAQAAEIIRSKTKGQISIVGHTDSKGNDAYNQKLSGQRAASVKTWLEKKGNLGQRKFITAGKGETQPVAPNAKPDGSDDPEGRQKNRRVEIVVKK